MPGVRISSFVSRVESRGTRGKNPTGVQFGSRFSSAVSSSTAYFSVYPPAVSSQCAVADSPTVVWQSRSTGNR